jgi:CheY-like chemotaxis protein/HPt (histidine-containing phosphotransfer) domain-containing protein
MFGTNHDVPRSTQSEQGLAAARERTETIFSTIIDELRTPLNAMLGMLELLRLSPLDSEQRQILDAAQDSGRDLMRIIAAKPIPIAAPAERCRRTQALDAYLSTRGEGARVLAVDDHPTVRALLAEQLSMLGFRVQTVESGQEALASWQGGGFLLVVTDCNMPGMDGYALSRAIREIEAGDGRPRTPIIGWTGNALASAAAQCRAAGMDDVLTKPARLGELKEVLSRWVGAAATEVVGPADVGPEGPSVTPATIIDLAALENIAVSAAERAEILRDFVTQTQSDLVDLEAASNARNPSVSVRIVHRINGASRMVGARELTAACETMERAARACHAEGTAAAKAALDRAVERLVTHLADPGTETR